jgi:hypothetical protein
MDTQLTKLDLSDLELLTVQETQQLLQDEKVIDPVSTARESLNNSGGTIENAAGVISRIMLDPSAKTAVRLQAAKQVMQIQGVAEDVNKPLNQFNTIVFKGDLDRALKVLKPHASI